MRRLNIILAGLLASCQHATGDHLFEVFHCIIFVSVGRIRGQPLTYDLNVITGKGVTTSAD